LADVVTLDALARVAIRIQNAEGAVFIQVQHFPDEPLALSSPVGLDHVADL
jgi:hypothetical protein